MRALGSQVLPPSCFEEDHVVAVLQLADLATKTPFQTWISSCASLISLKLDRFSNFGSALWCGSILRMSSQRCRNLLYKLAASSSEQLRIRLAVTPRLQKTRQRCLLRHLVSFWMYLCPKWMLRGFSRPRGIRHQVPQAVARDTSESQARLPTDPTSPERSRLPARPRTSL